MPEIVAREAELTAGDRFLSALETGPSSLLLEGDAGIGKTTVWAEVTRRAAQHGYRVLIARPVRPERELSLATLAYLVGQLEPADAAELPEPQRAAIEAVLLSGAAADRPILPRLLGITVRALLERLATDRPVVVAIDD